MLVRPFGGSFLIWFQIQDNEITVLIRKTQFRAAVGENDTNDTWQNEVLCTQNEASPDHPTATI